MSTAVKAKRRSERGHWLIVRYYQGKIVWCTWVRTWAGAQMSRRNAEKYVRVSPGGTKLGCVLVLDINRMVAFAVTEGANEINDLHKLWEKS